MMTRSARIHPTLPATGTATGTTTGPRKSTSPRARFAGDMPAGAAAQPAPATGRAGPWPRRQYVPSGPAGPLFGGPLSIGRLPAGRVPADLPADLPDALWRAASDPRQQRENGSEEDLRPGTGWPARRRAGAARIPD